MIWVGLTGGIASGKSTVAKIFESRGVTVIGADQLAHDAMAKNSNGAALVRKEFGDAVFRADGEVDRAKLGAIIFGDTSGVQRGKLEAILHPEVRLKSNSERQRLADLGHEMAVYEIPLLFEKKLEDQFDLIVTVAVSSEIQIERLMARSGLSMAEAHARIGAQLSQDTKIQASDFVIWNDGDVANLERQVEKIIADVTRKPRSLKS